MDIHQRKTNKGAGLCDLRLPFYWWIIFNKFFMLTLHSSFIRGGQFSSPRFLEYLKNLPDGQYEVQIQPLRKTPGRYKFYRGFVLPAILVQVGHLFIIDGEPITSTDQLHEILKAKYNRGTFLDTSTGETLSIGMSTRILNNDQFINRYQEMIMSDFADHPYYVEFNWKEDE